MKFPVVCTALLAACIELVVVTGVNISIVSADELGDAVRLAVSRADLSIVRLRPIGAQQTTDGGVMASAPTTGLVVSDQGEILTSAFALQGDPQAVVVETFDGQRHTARIVATDFVRKLVLLRVAEGTWTAPAVPSRDAVRVGQWVVAVGRFYSAETSNLSVGIVSARDRMHGLALQTDAKISPMNYGGPLLDLLGNVHGILVPMSPTVNDSAAAGVEWYDSGIGFAVPLEDAMRVLERLRSGVDQKRGLMGVSFTGSSRFSPTVIVSRIHRGGPGDLAGIRTGDRLISVNGLPVNRAAVIETVSARSYAGEKLALEVMRDDQQIALMVELTDQLPVVETGFLGLLPVARKAAEDAVGVDVVVLESGAAGAAGLTGRITVLKLNEAETKQASHLYQAAGQLSRGQDVLLEYTQPDHPEVRSMTLMTIERPEELADLIRASDLQNYVSDGVAPAEVKIAAEADLAVERQELDLGESGRCVLFHAASGLRERRAGLVMLLSAAGKPEEAILRRWKSVIISHDLTVAIPINPENARLTEEDLPLIGLSAMRALAERQSDRSRLVLVADEPESGIARKLLMDSRLPFRGVAMETGWLLPESGTSESQGLPRAVLLQDSRSDRQTQALLQQAATALKGAGFAVVRGPLLQDPEDLEQRTAHQIANWTMLIKCL